MYKTFYCEKVLGLLNMNMEGYDEEKVQRYGSLWIFPLLLSSGPFALLCLFMNRLVTAASYPELPFSKKPPLDDLVESVISLVGADVEAVIRDMVKPPLLSVSKASRPRKKQRPAKLMDESKASSATTERFMAILDQQDDTAVPRNHGRVPRLAPPPPVHEAASGNDAPPPSGGNDDALLPGDNDHAPPPPDDDAPPPPDDDVPPLPNDDDAASLSGDDAPRPPDDDAPPPPDDDAPPPPDDDAPPLPNDDDAASLSDDDAPRPPDDDAPRPPDDDAPPLPNDDDHVPPDIGFKTSSSLIDRLFGPDSDSDTSGARLRIDDSDDEGEESEEESSDDDVSHDASSPAMSPAMIEEMGRFMNASTTARISKGEVIRRLLDVFPSFIHALPPAKQQGDVVEVVLADLHEHFIKKTGMDREDVTLKGNFSEGVKRLVSNLQELGTVTNEFVKTVQIGGVRKQLKRYQFSKRAMLKHMKELNKVFGGQS